MTPQELDERIAVLYGISQSQLTDKADFKHFTERLIRDCIEAVTPASRTGLQILQDSKKGGEEYVSCRICGGYDECDCEGFNDAIDTIQANTKELLGDKQ